MGSVPPRSSLGAHSVKLSSIDNGCEQVIKHTNNVPQATVACGPQRNSVDGGGRRTAHLKSQKCPPHFSSRT